MRKTVLAFILLLSIATFISACGSVATPVWEGGDEAAETGAEDAIAEDAAVASAPTLVPTFTATPTIPPPTATATPLPPTATPTEEPIVSEDPIVLQVQLSNADNGEALFNTYIDEVGFACATCHSLNKDEVLVGPSQYGIALRAGEEVEGEVAQRYIYHSIIDPDAHIVAGFEGDKAIMPKNYTEIFTETEILDLVAYLMTLDGE